MNAHVERLTKAEAERFEASLDRLIAEFKILAETPTSVPARILE